MKKIILLATLIASSSVFAISDENLAKACLETGKEKLQKTAIKNLCILDKSSVYASVIDNTFYNQTKGITYSGTMNCLLAGNKVISQSVQYFKGACN